MCRSEGVEQMIKGVRIGGNGPALSYLDTLRVPIIANTPFEEDLTDSMAAAMEKYPEAAAILVRRHGIYVWGTSRALDFFSVRISEVDFPGDDWQKAKAQTEVRVSCYWFCEVAGDYLLSVPGLSVRNWGQDEARRYPDGSEQLMGESCPGGMDTPAPHSEVPSSWVNLARTDEVE